MAPNWNILKQKFDYMLDTSGEDINYITVGTQTYDEDKGLIFASGNTISARVSIQQTNKVDLEILPEGFRTKKCKKMYSKTKFDNNVDIVRSDGEKYSIIKPSDDYTANSIIIGYKTFIARKENQ